MTFFLDYNKDIIPKRYDKIVVSDYIFKGIVDDDDRAEIILEAPFLSKEKFNKAYNIAMDISDRLCDAVSKWLFRKYNIDFTMEQVRYIYGSFFVQHVYIISERYTRIRDLDMGDLYFEIPAYDVTAISFADTNNEEYNAFIYGLILRNLGANELTDRKMVSVDRRNEHLESTSSMLKSYVKDLLTQPSRVNYNLRRLNGYRHMYFNLSRKHINCNSLLIRSFLPCEGEIADSSDGAIYSLDANILRRQGLENYNVKCVDASLRRDMLSDFEPNNTLEKLIKSIILRLIPLSFCENFYSIYENVKPIADRFTVNKVYSAALYEVPMAMLAALKSKEGAEIIDIQHSGMYTSNVAAGYSEIYCFDEFITWGQYGEYPFGHVRGVAPTRFSNDYKTDNRIADNIDRILYVSNDANKYDLGNGVYNPYFAKRHFEFIEALPEKIRYKLVVRLRNDTYGFTHIYQEQYPEIQLEYQSDCSLSESIARSSLVVIDVNSSSYYESLMVGKPTLLFDGICFPIYHDKMTEWLRRLAEEGLYAPTGVEIAQIIAEQGDNIVSNWQGAVIQPLIEGFLKYTMTMGVDIKEAWRTEWMG